MSQEAGAAARRSRLPWVLLAAVVAVIAGVTLYRQFQSGAGQPAGSPDAADATATGIRVRDLSPEQLRALAAGSPGQSGPATAGDMAGMMEKRKRMAQATQARNRERNAAMVGRFAAERPDPAWSSSHEKALASLQDSDPMRDAGARAANLQIDCRSTMCRIQGDFPDAGAAANWLQLYMSGVGDQLPVATAHQVTNPDGSVRVEIYGIGRKR
jgi:hypothetical protein